MPQRFHSPWWCSAKRRNRGTEFTKKRPGSCFYYSIWWALQSLSPGLQPTFNSFLGHLFHFDQTWLQHVETWISQPINLSNTQVTNSKKSVKPASTTAMMVVVSAAAVVVMVVVLLAATSKGSNSLRLVLYYMEIGYISQCQNFMNRITFHTSLSHQCVERKKRLLPAENKPAPSFLETCFCWWEKTRLGFRWVGGLGYGNNCFLKLSKTQLLFRFGGVCQWPDIDAMTLR